MKRPPRLTRKDKIAMAAEVKAKEITEAFNQRRDADRARRLLEKTARRHFPDLDGDA